MAKQADKTDAEQMADTAVETQDEVQSLFQRQQQVGLAAAERLAEASFRFMSNRMSAYANHMKALQTCQTPADMASCHSEFLSQTLSDYAEQAQALAATQAETLSRLPEQMRGDKAA